MCDKLSMSKQLAMQNDIVIDTDCNGSTPAAVSQSLLPAVVLCACSVARLQIMVLCCLEQPTY